MVRTTPEAGSSARVDPLGDTAWCGRPGLGGCPGLAMVVTRLSLELRFQGGRLRGVRCELARWPRGAPPEPAASIVGQVLVPVLLSGLGVVAAGLLMNRVQVRTRGARRQTPQDRPRAGQGDWAWGRAGGSSWGCGHLRSRAPDTLARSACRDAQPGSWNCLDAGPGGSNPASVSSRGGSGVPASASPPVSWAGSWGWPGGPRVPGASRGRGAGC